MFALHRGVFDFSFGFYTNDMGAHAKMHLRIVNYGRKYVTSSLSKLSIGAVLRITDHGSCGWPLNKQAKVTGADFTTPYCTINYQDDGISSFSKSISSNLLCS
jgi:hypothetical protein